MREFLRTVKFYGKCFNFTCVANTSEEADAKALDLIPKGEIVKAESMPENWSGDGYEEVTG